MFLKFLQTRKRRTGTDMMNKIVVFPPITIRKDNLEIMILIFFSETQIYPVLKNSTELIKYRKL